MAMARDMVVTTTLNILIPTERAKVLVKERGKLFYSLFLLDILREQQLYLPFSHWSASL